MDRKGQPFFPSLSDKSILIWFFPIPQATEEIEKYLPLISLEEHQIAKRYVFEKDYIRYIFSKAKLRSLLSRYTKRSIKELIFRKNAFGKPYLWIDEEPSYILFNISHTTDYLAVAFSYKTEVGIDIEQIRDIPNYHAISKDYFSLSEYQYLIQLPKEKQLAFFFQYWTMKEAFLKGLGIGIGEGFHFLKKILCIDERLNIQLKEEDFNRNFNQPTWSVEKLPLKSSNHAASVAYQGKDLSVHCINLEGDN